MRLKVLFIFIFISWAGAAQTIRIIDSLRTRFINAQSDTAKCLALCEYAKSLIQDKPDSAFILARQAYEIANETNFKWGKAHAFFAMASSKKAATKYGEAINYYNQALELFKDFNNPSVIASTYNNMALVHMASGDVPSALLYFNKSIKLYRQANDLLGEATAVGNIGVVYYNDGNYEKSLEYDSLALIIAKKLNNQTSIARHVGNMGNAYMFRAASYRRRGMTKEMQIMYNKSIEALNFAYEINERINNKEGMALQIGNMANLYYDMGNMEKTMEYYNKALKICENSGNKAGMSRQYGNMGWIWFEAKDYKKAVEYTKKAIELLEDVSDLTLKYNWYDNLTGIYEAMGDYKSAYESYQQFILIRDSVYNIDKARKTLEAQLNFEFERKEESAKLEQARQVVIRNAFIVGFVLMLIMAVIVFRGYRNKKKANKLISEQKELVELKNKEITDSIRYAKRIQKAHLPHDDYIAKKLNELNKRS
jgi:tetratricopeptide (TPR) repeat protein